MTPEQTVLLTAAASRPDVVLVTAAGSRNDELWRALVDRGMLAAVTEFKSEGLAHLVDVANLRAYRVRPEATLLAAEAVGDIASQTMGTA